MKRKKQLPPWTPFVESNFTEDGKDIRELTGDMKVFVNSRYQVNCRLYEPKEDAPPGAAPMICLSIKRRDRKPVSDWRDKQRIKNEILGEEMEAVELFPAESRLVDSANQAFLWSVPIEGFRWPFGFDERLVSETPGGNAVQRPWEPGQRPPDAKSAAEMDEYAKQQKLSPAVMEAAGRKETQ